MGTDKLRKYVLPNIPYLFIGWACLKVGTAYRLAAGAGFGQKLLGIMQTIGVAFADFAPGLNPADWLVGVVGAVGFRLLIYCKTKKAKKFRHDAEYGTARWGTEKDIKPFIDPKFENNIILTATERLTMNKRPKSEHLHYRVERIWKNPLLAYSPATVRSFLLRLRRSQGRRPLPSGLLPAKEAGVQNQGIQQHRLFQVHAL